MWVAALGALVVSGAVLYATREHTLHLAVVGPAFAVATGAIFLLAKTYLITPLFFLPAIIVARLIDRETLLKNALEASTPALQITRVSIPSSDGVQLDGAMLTIAQARHWVIFCNANGVPFEQNLEFLPVYSSALPANVLTFNYRGVGASTGWPHRGHDLVRDGEAAVEFLLSKGVEPRHIIVHGHSLGGGVAAAVAHKYRDVKVIHDRTFRDMTTAASVILTIMNQTMSFAFAAVVVFSIGFTARFSAFSHVLPFWILFLSWIALGVVVQKSKVLFPLTPWVMRVAGWDLDVVSTFDAERGLCIYHLEDNVLPYQLSDAFEVLHRMHSANLRSFRLRGAGEYPAHMYPLNMYAAEWEELVVVLKSFMGIDDVLSESLTEGSQ
eukprot:m.255527 g.255527  ORF g.255527 m.255527 type:complete len:383 (-) comp19835_c0_seq1:133-1281(-)